MSSNSLLQPCLIHNLTRSLWLQVLVPARVRAGFDAQTSEDRGIAPRGEVVEVIKTRVNDAGILRVKYERGWISEFASDGTRLLEADEDDDGDDDESDFETDYTDMSKGTAIDRFEAVFVEIFEISSGDVWKLPLFVCNFSRTLSNCVMAW
jgi:hypothetical protein